MPNSKISALTTATTPLAGSEVLPVVQSSATKQVSVANLTASRTVQMYSLDANGGSSTGGAIISGSIPGIRASSTVLDVGDGNRYLALGANTTTPGLIKLISASSNASIYQYILTSDTSYNLTFNTGNLVQGTAAKGINFTANTPAAGMTSQLLNWYEEGTFTPTLTTDGTNFTSVVYNTQSGNYTRIGRTVSFSLNIYTSAVVKGLASGNVQIGGLPFAQNGSGIRCSPAIGVVLLWAGDYPSAGEIQDSSAKISLLKRTAANGATSNSVVADVATGAGNFIRISGTYFV